MKVQNKHKSASRQAIMWLIIFLITTLAGVSYYRFQYLPKLAAEAEAYDNAIAKVNSDIDSFFRKWKTTTVEDDKVLFWSGNASTVLFVDYSGPGRGAYGIAYGPRWLVWAKTESGRLFTISFYIDEKLNVVHDASPSDVTRTDLTKVLADKGRFDLIQKFGLSVGKA